MLLCNRTLFVPINKTGSTAVREALLASGAPCAYIEQIDPSKHMRHRDNQYHGHYHVGKLVPQLGPELGSLWVYTIVRNPWDRFASWYRWRRERRSFDTFLKDLLTPGRQSHAPVTQSSYIDEDGGLFDFIGTLEEIGKDWKTICQRVGYTMELEKKNVGPSSPTTGQLYTPELVDLVAEAEAYLIECFDYEWSG